MKLYHGLDEVDVDDVGTVVTLGNFDGVHRGHQTVLAAVAARAREEGLASIAMTFDPHPRTVHRPEDPTVMITSSGQKAELIAATGIDALLIQPYDLDFAAQTPEEFVRTYFVEALKARIVVVGDDVRFGRDNEGTIETLRRLGDDYGFRTETIDEVGRGGRYSSSRIREQLTSGDVAEAADQLGRYHAVHGTVVHGDARGRDLGFPTANLSDDHSGLVPADGVYAGRATFSGEGQSYPAAISVGTNPTFQGSSRRVEAYVLDKEFGEFDVYDREMTLEFVARIRGQVAFTGMDDLIVQMHEDIADVREVLHT
ncbi:bifunctional riboflavin kinase/FAD synthetase [Brevibacterium atlanticum]|uniref:bifunctional riboflavin kinase/FAD synthetase n=1 Tax=Brevibacterium atlanticum TaxID=2697563 RepID=UPI00141D9225|nr:bifunctional riboflavin kinase/FAD synthetase [Brevibacterium atlanticum]